MLTNSLFFARFKFLLLVLSFLVLSSRNVKIENKIINMNADKQINKKKL
jgi:hypothetical protein